MWKLQIEEVQENGKCQMGHKCRFCLIERNLMHFLSTKCGKKSIYWEHFSRVFSLLTHKMPDTEWKRQRRRNTGSEGGKHIVCPRNWRWVNCQLINSTRLAGKCCCYFGCCCCCSLGHQFNVCTLRHRGVGVAVQPACSTASSVTNGWTLKTKLRYAARIIHRFLIIFHITFVAFCLLPPRIF